MGNLRLKKVENGGVFIPWVIDAIGHITEIPSSAYIIPCINNEFEQKLLEFLKEYHKISSLDDIQIIG